MDRLRIGWEMLCPCLASRQIAALVRRRIASVNKHTGSLHFGVPWMGDVGKKMKSRSSHDEIWVWVKIRYPNNWMVNTNQTNICGPLGLPFWPTSISGSCHLVISGFFQVQGWNLRCFLQPHMIPSNFPAVLILQSAVLLPQKKVSHGNPEVNHPSEDSWTQRCGKI